MENCKCLPLFCLSYVKCAFGYGFWLYYISYGMCGVYLALVYQLNMPMLIIVLCLVVLKACVPKLGVQLYSCCPVWQLVVHLLHYVNIVILLLLLLLYTLHKQAAVDIQLQYLVTVRRVGLFFRPQGTCRVPDDIRAVAMWTDELFAIADESQWLQLLQPDIHDLQL